MAEALPQRLILELPPEAVYLPAAAAAAENAAQVCGLDRNKALRLSLAVEEFFAYLCRFAGREEPIRLTLEGCGTFVRADFRFRAGSVSLRALNFAASVPQYGTEACAPEDMGAADDLGLLLAARTTDRCSLERAGGEVYHLVAEVDRTYPEAEPVTSPQRLAAPQRIEEVPADGLLQHAAMLAAGRYPARSCPDSFFRPARFADMVAAGQYRALLAVDATGRPAGLLCWRGQGRKAVVFSGPYAFDPALAEQTAKLLTERFLSVVVRSEAVCALSERPTDDLPKGWFEHLGSLSLHDPAHPTDDILQQAYFRHLREDAGAAVWAHPALQGFLKEQYDRLAFSRDILTAPETSAQAEHSLLGTSLDLRKGLAVLLPLLPGRDMAANLAAHVQALHERDLHDILLRLDLSEPWQGALFPLIAEAGFAPRLVLPHAGNSDILVCQHVAAHS